MTRYRFLYMVLAVLGTLSSCCTSKNDNTVGCKTSSHADTNGFALELFDAICKTENKENFCISPTSATWALSMMANGAKGGTLSQITEAFGLKKTDVSTLNSHNRAMRTLLERSDTSVQLSFANSIWINNTLPVKQSFAKNNIEYYNALVERTPFNGNTLEKINNWCSENTNGKIASILDHLDENSKMILLNALYLKAQWTKPFSQRVTVDKVFTKENGDTMHVQMMKQKFTTGYFECNDFQMVSKPLGVNGKFEMLFILPREGKTVKEISTTFMQGYADYSNRMNKVEVELRLPKFKAEYGTSLKEILSQSGITDAFEENADFGKISKMPLKADDMIQKSYIAVDEEGVEAAAASAVIMVGMAMRQPTLPKVVNLNRPFIYLITERISGSREILFIGKTGAPQFQ